jgi:hypothetical protein
MASSTRINIHLDGDVDYHIDSDVSHSYACVSITEGPSFIGLLNLFFGTKPKELEAAGEQLVRVGGELIAAARRTDG